MRTHIRICIPGSVAKTVAIFLLVCLLLASFKGCGVAGWGPDHFTTATVSRTYVDHGRDASHYMVVTNAGVFEVDNGPLLHVWNADEIFGNIHEGRTYYLHTKGKQWNNLFSQEYPRIVHAQELPTAPPPESTGHL